MVEVDFGEPQEETRTVSVSELIITGGNATPLEGDFALDANDVQEALAARKAYLAELKDKKATQPAKKTAKPLDFGF